MAKCDNASIVRHRALHVLDAQLAADRRQQVNRNAAMHPGQSSDRKFKLAGDYFTAIFEGVDDHIHP